MKTERLIAIIMLLMECEKISASKLAQMFEVTKRTIYRDIDAINMAGIPIVTTSGINGGISIMKNYKVDKSLFTTYDLINLLSSLNSMSALSSKDNLRNTVNKIKGLIPEEHLQDLEEQLNYVTIDYSPWAIDESFSRNLEKIKQATKENKRVNFKYFDRLNQKTIRTVEPYRVVSKNGNWYFQGFCLARNDFRIFNLSRGLSRISDKTGNKKFLTSLYPFIYNGYKLFLCLIFYKRLDFLFKLSSDG